MPIAWETEATLQVLRIVTGKDRHEVLSGLRTWSRRSASTRSRREVEPRLELVLQQIAEVHQCPCQDPTPRLRGATVPSDVIALVDGRSLAQTKR
jgi:hypothetical protein